MSSSNRFNRGKQQQHHSNLNPNPKFPTPKPPSSSSSFPSSTTKSETSTTRTTSRTSSFPSSTTKSETSTTRTTSRIRRNTTNKNKKPSQIWVKKGSRRDWLDLPRDVLLHIFLKLNILDLLLSAQSVCSAWRAVALDPALYRRLDFSNPWDHLPFDAPLFAPAVTLALTAITRSKGQLKELLIDCFANNHLIHHIIKTNCSLTYIRLSACYNLTDEGLAKFVQQMTSLEELELCMTSFCPTKTLKAAGKSCPQLYSFRLNHIGTRVPRAMVKDEEVNDEAMAIADNLPMIRRLHLFGSLMTNKGLSAILDKCPRLEYLDLRQCFNVDMKGELLKKCERIKRVRLPLDSTEDYEFGSSINYMDSDSDIEPQYAYGTYEDHEEYYGYGNYDDFTDPFNDLRLSDDDGVNFFQRSHGGEGPSLMDLLFMEALMADDDDEDDDE